MRVEGSVAARASNLGRIHDEVYGSRRER